MTKHILLALTVTVALSACGEGTTLEAEFPPFPTDTVAGLDATADTGVQADASDSELDAAPETDIVEDAGPPPEWCTGPTAHRWSVDAEELEFFPDGTLVAEDSSSPTGLRLDYTVESAPWLGETPDLLSDAFNALNELSGFGTLGGIVLRFTAPVSDVPNGEAASTTSDGWIFADMSTEPPTRVPFESFVYEDGLTVAVWPLVSLTRDAEHAFIITDAALADDGDCIAPVEQTRQLVWGETSTERQAEHAPRYRAALEALEVDPAQVSVMTVYHTHDDLGPMLRLSANLQDETPEWLSESTCTEDGEFTVCEREFEIHDYRDDLGLIDDTLEPVGAPIPVRFYLPSDAEGPVPLIFYGHGLNSNRDEGGRVAARLTAGGYAVAVMEAVEHGDHPSVDPESQLEDALRFLGIDLTALSIDPFAIRGNINQTTIDRLRLIDLLYRTLDIDGDGLEDVTGQIAYLGVSLGSLLGTSLMALSPDLDAAIFSVGGARMMDIVTDTEELEQYQPIIELLVGSAEAFDRLIPVAQHLIDPADPGAWAPHVLRDRFDDRTAPNLLVAVGMHDEVVPRAAGRTLARTLGIPHLPPFAEPVETLQTLDAAPVAGNWADGERTAAFFQFDRVVRENGRLDRAKHTAVPLSDEGVHQMRVFLDTWAAGEAPEVVDPYADLGTPVLEEE